MHVHTFPRAHMSIHKCLLNHDVTRSVYSDTNSLRKLRVKAGVLPPAQMDQGHFATAMTLLVLGDREASKK
jgi:hypothetical protein